VETVEQEAEEGIASEHVLEEASGIVSGAVVMELDAEPAMDRVVIPGIQDQVKPSFFTFFFFLFSFYRLVTNPAFDQSKRRRSWLQVHLTKLFFITK